MVQGFVSHSSFARAEAAYAAEAAAKLGLGKAGHWDFIIFIIRVIGVIRAICGKKICFVPIRLARRSRVLRRRGCEGWIAQGG